jgi:hypothetical protein
MNCKELQEELVFYLDGELSQTESETVALHLSSCQACSHEVTALKDSIRLLQRLPRLETKKNLEGAVWARIERARERHRLRSFFTSRYLIPVGAAVAFGYLLFLSPVKEFIFPGPQEEITSNVDFLVNYPIIQNLETLRDLDVIEKLPKSNGRASVLGGLWLS